MFISLFLKGFIIGIAFIIPGVSGGTLAVYLGVYQKMLNAIGDFYKDFKNSFKILFPIFLGIGLSVVALAKIFSILIDWNSYIVLWFFIGLIIGGIKFIYLKAKTKDIGLSHYLSFIISFALLILLVVFDKISTNTGLDYFTFSLGTYLLLFILGMIASITMIVPGISGSALLLVLGFYTAIVSNVVGNIFDFSVFSYNLKVLIPFGFGALIGVFLFSNFIGWTLKKYLHQTYFAILGFVSASVIGVFLEIRDQRSADFFSDQTPIFQDFFAYISSNLWTVIAGLAVFSLGIFIANRLTGLERG